MKHLTKRIFATLLLLLLLLTPVDRLAACQDAGIYCQTSDACTIFSHSLSNLATICQSNTANDGKSACTFYRLLQFIMADQITNSTEQAAVNMPNAAPQIPFTPEEGSTSLDRNSDTYQQPVTSQNRNSAEEYAAEVINLVNAERAAAGLSALEADPILMEAAMLRADEIIDLFSHTRPDGSSCFTALDELQAEYRMAGENIAIGQRTPQQVVKAWMDSPGHRENILNPDYRRIGVACLENDGEYGGYAWAQFFAD